MYPSIEYKIKPTDLLHVKIISMEESGKSYLDAGAIPVQVNSQSSLFLMNYLVFEDGTIELPLIGKFAVSGKSTEQIASELNVKLGEYMKFTSVSVKLVNFKVTVLGEVLRPGVQYVFEAKFTLLNALANAGETNLVGQRKKVKLIRETEKGIIVKHFDLTDDDLLSSEAMFLQPGDVIYVQPTRASLLTVNSRVISVVGTALSLIVLVTNFLTK